MTTNPRDFGATGKRCCDCGKPKPLAAFRPGHKPGATRSRCRVCQRIADHHYGQTEHGKAVRRASNQRPERSARESVRARQPARIAAVAAYRNTVKGRLVNARSVTRSRLKRATSPERRQVLAALVAAQTREIERIQLREAAA